jgi:surfactin synthase thioesterase subunit
VAHWSSDAWLRRYHPATDGAPTLVCFPHAGGSASWFHPVSAALTPAVEVLSVQYPGRQDRRDEPCAGSIEGLADAITEVLRPVAGPRTALFGHSMGAVLAFEVARRLDRQPETLFVSGRRAPCRPRPERLHLATDETVLAELRQLDGTDARLFADDELVRMIMPALRADYRVIETYVPDPDAAVDCPVVALVGAADPRTTPAEAEAWARHTTGRFDLHVFPGGHFYLAAQRDQVLDVLSSYLTVRAA